MLVEFTSVFLVNKLMLGKLLQPFSERWITGRQLKSGVVVHLSEQPQEVGESALSTGGFWASQSQYSETDLSSHRRQRRKVDNRPPFSERCPDALLLRLLFLPLPGTNTFCSLCPGGPESYTFLLSLCLLLAVLEVSRVKSLRGSSTFQEREIKGKEGGGEALKLSVL